MTNRTKCFLQLSTLHLLFTPRLHDVTPKTILIGWYYRLLIKLLGIACCYFMKIYICRIKYVQNKLAENNVICMYTYVNSNWIFNCQFHSMLLSLCVRLNVSRPVRLYVCRFVRPSVCLPIRPSSLHTSVSCWVILILHDRYQWELKRFKTLSYSRFSLLFKKSHLDFDVLHTFMLNSSIFTCLKIVFFPIELAACNVMRGGGRLIENFDKQKRGSSVLVVFNFAK